MKSGKKAMSNKQTFMNITNEDIYLEIKNLRKEVEGLNNKIKWNSKLIAVISSALVALYAWVFGFK